MGRKRKSPGAGGLRTGRWDEARWRLAQAKLAEKLVQSFPARISPWLIAYAQDVEALLEALGETTEVGDEAVH